MFSMRLKENKMCSIFGILNIKTDPKMLCDQTLKLSSLMFHRGPDWSEIFASQKAILAHEILSIVDVNAVGNQPTL